MDIVISRRPAVAATAVAGALALLVALIVFTPVSQAAPGWRIQDRTAGQLVQPARVYFNTETDAIEVYVKGRQVASIG